MKKNLIIICLLIWETVFSQTEIKMQSIENIKKQYLEDSSNTITTVYPIEISSFYTNFTKVKFDKHKQKIYIEGQVFRDKSSQIGFDNVQIFTAIRNANVLSEVKPICKTTFMSDTSNFRSAGFFKLSVKVRPNLKLYIYKSSYFLKEYKVDSLLKRNPN